MIRNYWLDKSLTEDVLFLVDEKRLRLKLSKLELECHKKESDPIKASELYIQKLKELRSQIVAQGIVYDI